MDDLINVKDMKESYQIIDETIQSLDNKSVQMISIIGVMFTIQITILPKIVYSFGAVLLVLSLLAYFISSFLFIRSCITRKYKFYPTPESVCAHYEEELSIEEYVSYYIGEGEHVVNHNLGIVQSKGKFSCYAFYFFIIGLFLTLLTVCFVVLL